MIQSMDQVTDLFTEIQLAIIEFFCDPKTKFIQSQSQLILERIVDRVFYKRDGYYSSRNNYYNLFGQLTGQVRTAYSTYVCTQLRSKVPIASKWLTCISCEVTKQDVNLILLMIDESSAYFYCACSYYVTACIPTYCSYLQLAILKSKTACLASYIHVYNYNTFYYTSLTMNAYTQEICTNMHSVSIL